LHQNPHAAAPSVRRRTRQQGPGTLRLETPFLRYARVSAGGQTVDAQDGQLRAAGAGKVFREVASGAKTDRARLRRLVSELTARDVVMVTRLARSTRDLLNTLAAITEKKAGFRSLGDSSADTTTAHGRLILTVLRGLAEGELIRAHK
jgi:DNA invertase Pin-like site-specific DNA recombinase